MREVLEELYRFRGLVLALVGRHLSSRYRGSVLGYFWSLLNPLFLMLVYTLVFQYYMRFSSVDNYTIFLFTGLLPWLWVTSSLSEASSSLVSSGHLITQSMFPAHILPLVTVLTNMIHFFLALPLLFLFMWFFEMPLYATVLFLPVLILLQFLFLYGLALLLSALNVFYRDVQHIVGNVLNFLFFLCPILYPLSVVPEKFHWTFHWNPFASMTNFYHAVLLEGQLPALQDLGYFCFWTVLVLMLGTGVFRAQRESFAEML